MKLGNKLAIGGLALSVFSLPTIIRNGGETYPTSCETYQGYTDNGADGERIFVFDEQIRESRINRPNYALSGDPKMYEDLEIGDKYKLKIREPMFSMYPKKLLSFENCGQKII